MRFTLAAVVLGTLAAPPCAASDEPPMVRVTLPGHTVEGAPLAWNDSRVQLLGRDGRLFAFDPAEVQHFQPTATRFRSYGVSELRAMLLRELGQEYEVSGTSHYLVAHPRDQGARWDQRFEDLYREFVHYFTVRGFKLAEPQFLLLGVVHRNREEFARLSGENGPSVDSGVVGCYNATSNRISLYDMGGGEQSAAWKHNAAVLIHEATHQMAFNTGIHSRTSPPPRWVAEGLATLFEAPGVYDSRQRTQLADRINRQQLDQFRRRAASHRPEVLKALVAGDELFFRSPWAAYCEAWALTFYLVESEPRKYARYLALTAGCPAMVTATAEERLSEFESVFGRDWRMLESRLLRFVGELGRAGE